MKIAVCSDLHLEFGDLVLKNEQGADVLILSGDILVANHLRERDVEDTMLGMGVSERYHKFLQNVCSEFKDVVYVMGNHEHYDGDFPFTEERIRFNMKYLPNFHVLEKSCVKIDDVTFIGGTLWTDMNKEDSLTLYHVSRRMNDFRIIKNSNRMTSRSVPIYEKNPLYTDDGKNGGQYKLNEYGYYIKIGEKIKDEPSTLSPEDVVVEFKKMVDYINIVTSANEQKFVVVGHHAPSKASTHPRYQGDTLMNGAYSSSLDEFILDRPQIKLWTHGHTHEPFDYMIGSTRIVCNPRGYIGHEKRADNFELKYVEI